MEGPPPSSTASSGSSTPAPWRDLPRTYGPWQTVYERFNRWSKDGTWGRLLEALHVRLDAAGKIDWDLFCIDGSSIRASRDAAGASPTDGTPAEPADHALGRSRGGFGSKIHLVCDGKGLPMAVTVTAGQRHESTQFEAVMGQVRVPRPEGPAASPAEEAGRGQGLQLPPDPALPAAPGHQGGDPDPQGPEAAARLRQGDLPASQRGGALHRLAEGSASAGDAVREAGGELPGDGQAGDDPPVFTSSRFIRQALEVRGRIAGPDGP